MLCIVKYSGIDEIFIVSTKVLVEDENQVVLTPPMLNESRNYQ